VKLRANPQKQGRRANGKRYAQKEKEKREEREEKGEKGKSGDQDFLGHLEAGGAKHPPAGP
jgi:hypothetical protein